LNTGIGRGKCHFALAEFKEEPDHRTLIGGLQGYGYP
jgi:hypothetical protein